MSRKKFITSVMFMNMVICLVMGAMYFKTDNKNENKDVNVETITSQVAQEGTTQSDLVETDSNQSTSTEEQKTMPEETTSLATTQPVVTTAENSATTSAITSITTETTAQETTIAAYAAGKTTAVASKACNVRSGPDVGASVIGQTVVGVKYDINPAKCDSNWVAIDFNGVEGYIATGYCSVN